VWLEGGADGLEADDETTSSSREEVIPWARKSSRRPSMRLRRSEMDEIDSSLLPLSDEPAVAGGAAERVEADILLDADGYWHSAANGLDQRKNEDELKQTQTTTRERWGGEDAQGARSSFNGVNTSTETTAMATLRPVATASSLFAATFQAC
jgi:hypothetical protein